MNTFKMDRKTGQIVPCGPLLAARLGEPGLWVTRKQALLLGGYAEQVVVGNKSSNDFSDLRGLKRRTANNSSQIISFVPATEVGITVSFKIPFTREGKQYFRRMTFEYFHISQVCNCTSNYHLAKYLAAA